MNKIILNPNDMRWMTSKGIERNPALDLTLKQRMQEAVFNNKPLLVSFQDLETNYGKISTLYKAKLLTNPGEIDRYFRFFGDIDASIPTENNVSHNVVVYHGIESSMSSEGLISDELCSIKPIDFQKKLIYGFGGQYQSLPLDIQSFPNIKDNGYGLTHGSNESGLIVVTNISKKEFENAKNLFKKTHQDPKNKFMNKGLENLLPQYLERVNQNQKNG